MASVPFKATLWEEEPVLTFFNRPVLFLNAISEPALIIGELSFVKFKVKSKKAKVKLKA